MPPSSFVQSNGELHQNGKDHGQVDEALALNRLLEVATVVITQAIDLVENSLSSDDQLTAPSQYIPGSTIGKHLRHARDHYVLLLECISSPPPHVLNYDLRLRNTPMETSRAAARDALHAVIKQLEDVVPKAHLDAPITLHAITPYEQIFQWCHPTANISNHTQSYGSGHCMQYTIGRWYVSPFI
ncbi:hypothetical protein K474DRAFT_1663241 [Panus rudis PR-1116 ss-1]|nr:hypothetical protein K474DRAFT_1663241 [Panus rudis PR-1116 ss-1]